MAGIFKRVKKPWGEEIWFAVSEHYAGKLIKVKKGHRLSLQYHKQKHETLYVLEGKVKLTEGASENNLKERIIKKGEIIVNPPNWRHRMEALEDTTFIEVSTPQLEDVVRIEDDYGRLTK